MYHRGDHLFDMIYDNNNYICEVCWYIDDFYQYPKSLIINNNKRKKKRKITWKELF